MRTTDSLVQAIITTTVSDTAPYIGAANVVVTALAGSVCGSSLVEATLIQIETWLAAHFIAVSGVQSEQAVKSLKFEDAQTVYSHSMVGSGVNGSTYGQTANLLSGGCLSKMDTKKSSVFFS